MATVIIVLLVLVFAASAFFSARTLWMTLQLRHVTSTRTRLNAGPVAMEEFLKLLDEARREMIIYDDGDMVADSIYAMQELVDAVREKLKSSSEFRMRCLFNAPDDSLPFMKAFGHGVDRVTIKPRDRNRHPFRTHYKIIDGGRKAYLSEHSLGSRERWFKIVDCTKVPEKHVQRASELAFGGCLNDFNQAFASD